MENCSVEHCDCDAEYIDSMDNYYCTDCMDDDLENNYTGQRHEDYEILNWFDHPKNGYSR